MFILNYLVYWDGPSNDTCFLPLGQWCSPYDVYFSSATWAAAIPLGVFLHPGSLLSAIPTGKDYRPVAVGPTSVGGVVSSSGLQPVSRGAGRRLLFYLEVRFSVLGFRPWAPLIGGQCLPLLQGVRTTCSSKNKAHLWISRVLQKPVSVLFPWNWQIFQSLWLSFNYNSSC